MQADLILNFHGVGQPVRTLEPGEGAYWISADQFRAIVEEIRKAPRRVGITFDDGNASDLEICAPILAEAGLSAMIFVLAGRLGRAGSLAGPDLLQLQAMGCEIGSHGHDHIDWRHLDQAGELRELVEAREIIASASGRPVREAAIPFGNYDRRVLTMLRHHGYERIHTSDGGPAGGGWLVPRTSVRADMDLARIREIISGQESGLRRLRRRAAMLRKRLL